MRDAMELVVCTTCRLPGTGSGAGPGTGPGTGSGTGPEPGPETGPEAPRDGARLSAALEARGIPHRRQECLSACARGCAVVFRGPGRWTYVQGALDPDRDIPDLLAMIAAYAAAPDGLVPWRARPPVIRRNTIARIPPMEP